MTQRTSSQRLTNELPSPGDLRGILNTQLVHIACIQYSPGDVGGK